MFHDIKRSRCWVAQKCLIGDGQLKIADSKFTTLSNASEQLMLLIHNGGMAT